MNRIIYLFLMSLFSINAFTTSSSDYQTLLSQSMLLNFEDVKSQQDYLQDVKQRLTNTSFSHVDLTLVSKDFHFFEKNYTEDHLKRFYKNQKTLYKKLANEIKYDKHSSLSQAINTWMNFSLTKNEKESLNYMLSLKDQEIKTGEPYAKSQIQILLRSFEDRSLEDYYKKGFSLPEALYARHTRLYNEMLNVLKTHFDPEIYFHIESCLQAEEKILLQSYLDDQLYRFARAEIAANKEHDDVLRDLLKMFFLKRSHLD